MPSTTAADVDDPVYRWVRAFGLFFLASHAYLVILGPLSNVVFGTASLLALSTVPLRYVAREREDPT